MSKRKPSDPDIGEWIVVFAAIMIFWPVGVCLLAKKLMGHSKTKKSSGTDRTQGEYHYTGEQLKQNTTSARKNAAPTYGQKSSASSAKREKEGQRIRSGKGLTAAGGIMTALFGIGGVSKFLDYLSWGGLKYAWSELFVLFGLTAVGIVLLLTGLSRSKKAKRFQKYLNTIGKQKKIPVSVLAGATGISVRRLCEDLDEMLEDGILPVGHLDRASAILYLTDEGVQAPVREEPKKEDEYTILKEIREVNEAIPDAEMSAKIDRIENITKKILDYQKKNPGRDAELRSFLDYYLPTTLKILRAYAQLEAQGIDGENITAAKTRIEGMMDMVVEGFETQLDKLFASDTLDITSDVQVLEQMLKKDGLSSDQEGFQLKL